MSCKRVALDEFQPQKQLQQTRAARLYLLHYVVDLLCEFFVKSTIRCVGMT